MDIISGRSGQQHPTSHAHHPAGIHTLPPAHWPPTTGPATGGTAPATQHAARGSYTPQVAGFPGHGCWLCVCHEQVVVRQADLHGLPSCNPHAFAPYDIAAATTATPGSPGSRYTTAATGIPADQPNNALPAFGRFVNLFALLATTAKRFAVPHLIAILGRLLVVCCCPSCTQRLLCAIAVEGRFTTGRTPRGSSPTERRRALARGSRFRS